jgi:hypothetical protein
MKARDSLTAPFLVASLLACTLPTAASATCRDVRTLLRQGYAAEDVAAAMGLTLDQVGACAGNTGAILGGRGAAGPAPLGAAGPAPLGAAGPAPLGAAGPAPLGAAGPPPLGAAGPPPRGAAGPPPLGAAGPAPGH